MSKKYRASGTPTIAQSSHHTWTNYEKAKPVKAVNRNGKVKTIKSRKRRARMPDMQDIFSQLNGAVATEPEVEPEVLVEQSTKKPKPASGTVSIATGSITIAKKKRGDKIVRLLEIELSQEQLTELGITD